MDKLGSRHLDKSSVGGNLGWMTHKYRCRKGCKMRRGARRYLPGKADIEMIFEGDTLSSQLAVTAQQLMQVGAGRDHLIHIR